MAQLNLCRVAGWRYPESLLVCLTLVLKNPRLACIGNVTEWCLRCRGAVKSLVRPGRKQGNVSVRMVWISFGALPCRAEKKLDDSSRLDVVEIARVPDMLPSLFPSRSGWGLISTPVWCCTGSERNCFYTKKMEVKPCCIRNVVTLYTARYYLAAQFMFRNSSISAYSFPHYTYKHTHSML